MSTEKTCYRDHGGRDHLYGNDGRCLQIALDKDPSPDADLHEPRARRYAEALATAVAVEARVAALLDIVAEHEWHRTQAEMQAGALKELWQVDGHRLILSTEDCPDAGALLDLYTGRVWVCTTRHTLDTDPPTEWVRAATAERHQTRYTWPIEDAGPFIAISDGFDILAVNREARAFDEQARAIKEKLRRFDGWRDGDSWLDPPISEGLSRVVDELLKRAQVAESEKRTVENEVRRLTDQVSRLTAALEEARATSTEGASS